MTDPENPWEVDLWGNALYRTRGKRGRPPFRRTQENANKVSMLLSLGWSNERIAGCVLDPRTGKSISVPTLKRYFRSELFEREMARDRMLARLFAVAFAKAVDEGNVGALRAVERLLDRNDRALAERRLARETAGAGEAAAARPGKKQLAEMSSQDADDQLMAELEREAEHALRH